MIEQFRYYTEDITLVPMGGQPSIPYKWDCAKRMEGIEEPIIILYFGDLDKGGDDIAECIEKDVREWTAADFRFIRCGLNLDQVQKYNVPENPQKPGDFQWEALSNEAAGEIIGQDYILVLVEKPHNPRST